MTDTLPSLGLALLLGLRHGLAPDHLAVVDGLTMRARAATAPWMGALFSLGHGCVMLAIVALAGLAGATWQPHGRLADIIGLVEWLPGVLLLTLAALNARALLAGAPPARSSAMPLPRAIAGGAVAGVWSALGIGMLFAFGFESILQALAWGYTAALHDGSVGVPLQVAAVFVLGMSIADTLDGYATARIAAMASPATVQALRRKLGWPIVALCVFTGGQLLLSRLCEQCALHDTAMEYLGAAMIAATIAVYAGLLLRAVRAGGRRQPISILKR